MIKVSVKELLVISAIVVSMLGFSVYGFFVMGVGNMPENCWDKYSTEQEAIMNCEGEQ